MNARENVGSGDRYGARVNRRRGIAEGVAGGAEWHFVCRTRRVLRSMGGVLVPTIRWEDGFHNLVPTGGLNHIGGVILNGGTQDTTWFAGLLGSSPSPQAGWVDTDLAAVDFVDYDEATLQAWTGSAISGGVTDNSAAPFVFTISQDASTIGGGFLIGTNAKATPAGTLLSAGAFTGGNKSADDNDTLTVTLTFTFTSA